MSAAGCCRARRAAAAAAAAAAGALQTVALHLSLLQQRGTQEVPRGTKLDLHGHGDGTAERTRSRVVYRIECVISVDHIAITILSMYRVVGRTFCFAPRPLTPPVFFNVTLNESTLYQISRSHMSIITK